MIVLKRTYDKLFELFVKEKHGALDLYKENQALRQKIFELEEKLRRK